MSTRVLSFLNQCNIIYHKQLGFRTNHSTEMALISLISQLLKAKESKLNKLGIFLDFSKAFDTANFNILLYKLEFYGIRGPALKWVKKYLDCRQQHVQFLNSNSHNLTLSTGVPQGSIFGLHFFLIYNNDLPSVSKILQPILYADDSNFVFSFPPNDDPSHIVNLELSKVMDWLAANRLSVNLNKSHFIMFRNANVRHPTICNLKIKNVNLEQVTSTKFLGFVIEEDVLEKARTIFM